MSDEQEDEASAFNLIGRSEPMLKVLALVKKAAAVRVTVLITGESGTGKEMVARAIHKQGDRASGPWVPVNCAAIPKSLLEAELFGREKGAFTGADKMQVGKFEAARGGTIFLDEIAEIPLDAQPKMLRVLQEKEVERVGGNNRIPVNLRVIAATNRNLKQRVKTGQFREDLFYRLNVLLIEVPPLRRRKEDIPLLASHFMHRYASLNPKSNPEILPEAMDALMAYEFPGNIRELENIIERALVLSDSKRIALEDLPEDVTAGHDRCALAAHSSLDGEALLSALLQATKNSWKSGIVPWHQTLKNGTSLQMIHSILMEIGPRQFSRREFSDRLNTATNSRDKYGTAGRYIQVLVSNGILIHNGRKANASRYRLHEKFFAAP